MALSNTGMRDKIISELPDPMISGVTKDEALRAAGGRESIMAVASAVVDDLKRATASLSFATTGTCSNTTQNPGTFNGSISASSVGEISGMDADTLKQDIKDNIESALSGVNFTAGNADDTVEAVAEAIVEEIEDQGKISLSSTTVSGSVVAGGGKPTGTITATCDIDSLSATRLRTAFKTKIDEKIDEDVEFVRSGVDELLLALAEGIIDHIHNNADVNVSTDFSGVTCPPSGGTHTGDGVSEDDASIS